MIPESVYLSYLDNLLEGNKSECAKIITDLLEQGVNLKDIYISLIQRSMYWIGSMWENDRSSIAAEHVATKITESMLTLMYPQIMKTPRNGKSVIITCVDKEFHEIGPRIIADFFELKGWNARFYGANMPQNEVIKEIGLKQPDVVGISINFYINVIRLLKLIEEIKRHHPDQKIIVGGQALSGDHSEVLSKYKNVFHVSSIDALEEYIENFD
ncbi:MAG: cobalamin B12-binding domain-containing protein [Melioribacteraceae bacterium]|nr:cobalamin B12-binding domain-containing protein [Melioribacteraceae bacterium]MCF8430457.1 cobalamin B12-binding domain-containing protein [Melioribacteraceae bacterium]